MRLTVFALAAALALPCAAKVPAVDAFFDGMAITVAPGRQAQFVAGDNLAGYFESYTQSYGKGAGYVIKNEHVFEGYASFAGGVQNDRTRSSEQVLPYGHRVRYANGATEEMALLSKQQAIAIRVFSATLADLAIRPMLKAGAITRSGKVVTIAPAAGNTLFVALAADQPFTIDDALTLRGAAPARELTVVAAFGASAAQAAQRALALSASDPIKAERQAQHAALTKSYLSTSDGEYNKALNWAKAASRMFVVEEFGTGIWAGLPWFRDNWGRDTFIALPGTLLVSGQFDDAKAVLANFARYQNLKEPRDKEYGRVPNRVAAGDSIIYNTVDGTPWMLREALEYIRYTGDKAFAQQMYKLAVPYFEGAIANYMDQDGLLAHDSADTWMDARIEGKQPWSARGPRAVEIQALWYTALQTGAYLAAQAGDQAKADQWNGLAQRAKSSFLRLYWDGALMADRLRDDASRDTRVRPNQLMLVSVPFDDFVPPGVQARVTRNAVSQLLYPYGIASLSQDDPYFHPRHENPDFHHKDAAYHQGTIWGWNAGYTVTALNKFGYQDLAWPLAQNLGHQILRLGTLGNMSELLDALPHEGGKLKPSGTYAQSWSVAEYARNGYQDFVGFKPNLLDNTLAFSPAIPGAWKHFDARLPFGAGEHIEVAFVRKAQSQRWRLQLAGAQPRMIAFSFLNADKSRSRTTFELAPGKVTLLQLDGGEATLDGKPLAVMPQQASFASTIGALRFRTPRAYRPQDFPMLRARDVLKGIVEREEYK
ncbi:MAG: amylo-alpha-1,6-glucosidase [Pseudomonadota bacterium]